ncbi:multicopper oxidase domain-containing protein [Pseudonocardia abyssalis]|uniref:multicopper oxidase domain-containing protein n=1 Tax=Pseudonocardia abyssalis TaxID=2792008 RepID=UPI00226B0888|nr:multicopper oxidase domain-containing protein [Pseudonocardia abyssalis]
MPDAGTYWFHPHVGAQLDRGLYAPLIVEDPDEPADYDQELVVVFDDARRHRPRSRPGADRPARQRHGRDGHGRRGRRHDDAAVGPARR